MTNYQAITKIKGLIIKNRSLYEKFGDESFAQNFYAALCNNDFEYSGTKFSISWRGAGAFVADIVSLIKHQEDIDYLHFYCSGIISEYDPESNSKYVSEGTVTDEVLAFLKELNVKVL